MVAIKRYNVNAVLDVLKNTLPNNINEIINNYITEGIDIYKKNKITHPDIEKFPQQDILLNYWNYSIYITCNILYYKNISINCVLTNKVISSVYSNLFTIPTMSSEVYTYYLFSEGDNTCILVCGSGYNLPCFVYYVYINVCFDLINAPFGIPYGDIEYYNKIINILMTNDDICSIINNLLPFFEYLRHTLGMHAMRRSTFSVTRSSTKNSDHLLLLCFITSCQVYANIPFMCTQQYRAAYGRYVW
jgi:hypothetical protein